MSNYTIKIEESKLIITVDLTKDEGPSKTGKTLIVGSSNGFVKIGPSHPDISLNLNVVKSRK